MMNEALYIWGPNYSLTPTRILVLLYHLDLAKCLDLMELLPYGIRGVK